MRDGDESVSRDGQLIIILPNVGEAECASRVGGRRAPVACDRILNDDRNDNWVIWNIARGFNYRSRYSKKRAEGRALEIE